jgi:hypothetical protein
VTKEEKLKYCSGCYNNIYNQGAGGAKECWSLENAEVVMRKEVHIDQVPPWNQKPIKVLSCYTKPRYCYMRPDRTC